MLIEIFRKCNSIKLSLIEDICITISKNKYDYNSLLSHCRDFSNFDVSDFENILEILQNINYIYVNKNIYISKKIFEAKSFLENLLKEIKFNNEITKFIDINKIQFYEGDVYINIRNIKLEDSTLRNFLLREGVFCNVYNNVELIKINKDYEKYFVENYELTQEKLNNILEKEKFQGDLAEEYVMNYEKNRLNGRHEVIKISQINVMEGYDILSYENCNKSSSQIYIEVKSYSTKKRFFITKNEIERAKEYGDKYYIYIVDIKRIKEKNYKPKIIRNPYKEIIVNNTINKVVEVYSINLEEGNN